AYGEAEFIFASIKVITIVGLIILGIVLDLGGGPNHDRIGFRYWLDPGPFVQFNEIPGAKGRFLGWWAVMTQAVFSFIGTEIVSIAAGETKNPRRNIPRAIKRVYIRILLFYIGGTFIIVILVLSTSPGLNMVKTAGAFSGPFVIAIQMLGIGVCLGVINAALLSSGGPLPPSVYYTASRRFCMLSFLPFFLMSNITEAIDGSQFSGQAPSIILLTTSSRSSMGLHRHLLPILRFSAMTAMAGLLTWLGISITYLRFYAGMRAQGFDRQKLPFKSNLQPYAGWYACVGCVVICIFSGWKVFLTDNWETDTFITNYLPVALFPIMFVGCKVYRKTRFVRVEEMDFVSGVEEVVRDSYEEPPPRNVVEKVWAWLAD
ncbi:hypothetical protein VNI00_019371, partial [Paramarasmius palmivorus]